MKKKTSFTFLSPFAVETGPGPDGGRWWGATVAALLCFILLLLIVPWVLSSVVSVLLYSRLLLRAPRWLRPGIKSFRVSFPSRPHAGEGALSERDHTSRSGEGEETSLPCPVVRQQHQPFSSHCEPGFCSSRVRHLPRYASLSIVHSPASDRVWLLDLVLTTIPDSDCFPCRDRAARNELIHICVFNIYLFAFRAHGGPEFGRVV